MAARSRSRRRCPDGYADGLGRRGAVHDQLEAGDHHDARETDTLFLNDRHSPACGRWDRPHGGLQHANATCSATSRDAQALYFGGDRTPRSTCPVRSPRSHRGRACRRRHHQRHGVASSPRPSRLTPDSAGVTLSHAPSEIGRLSHVVRILTQAPPTARSSATTSPQPC